MILIIGSINMDLVLRTPRMPLPGETLAGSSFMTIPGGKGANQAVACARLAPAGTAVAMVACLGADAFGQQLRQSLVANGVDDRGIASLADESTGIASILVDDQAQNSIVLAAGANARVTTQQVEQARALVDAAAVVLLQLEIPLPTVLHAIDMAHALGKTVVLNPAPAPATPLPPGLLQKVDYLVLNEIEAAMLAGQDPATASQDIPALAGSLRRLGARNVVITLGAEGVYGDFADCGQGHVAAQRVKAVDTTAAGDTFIGGFVGALVEGRAPFDAIAWGQVAAAISVTRVGAQTSIPSRAEVQARSATDQSATNQSTAI